MRVKTIERTEKYFDDCVNRWLHDNESKVDIKEITISKKVTVLLPIIEK